MVLYMAARAASIAGLRWLGMMNLCYRMCRIEACASRRPVEELCHRL
jgi:hypothetical protein